MVQVSIAVKFDSQRKGPDFCNKTILLLFHILTKYFY